MGQRFGIDSLLGVLEGGKAPRLPLETGEKRHDSDDDDLDDIDAGHGDSWNRSHVEAEPTVEWCLREFEETLTERQHGSEEGLGQAALAGTERGEATGEPSLDPVEEGYPQETEVAAHEENRESSLLEWSLGEYEATMTPLASGSEATSETGEHGATIAEHDQLSGSESENQRNVGVQANREEVAATQEEEAIEQGETVRQRNTSSETKESTETPTAENQQYSHQSESEVNEQRTESSDRSDEHFPLRLSEDPDAFVGENLEQLVELGILPEKDEAKLNDNTILRFDVSEGLTITHGEQSYEITNVGHERIGDMDLYRYISEHGEEFLHIPDQGKLVPPTEMTWYVYPPNTEAYLDREYKHELFEAAVDKAGGIFALRDELQRRGTDINATFVYKHLHDLRDGMAEDKLIPILNYLGRDLDEVNVHITAIGHTGAVEHPELPFDLNEKHGARLMAARCGDGTLSASKDHGPTFHYANKDAEMRDRVVESLIEVFGGANILNREYSNGEVAKVRTSTDIIGHALQRAGAVTGEMFRQNPHVPTWIEQGSMEMKHEWLVQTFGDEGYVWPHKGKVCLGRATEIDRFLTDDMMNQLRSMEWHERREFGKYVHHAISCADLPPEIRATIQNHPPNLLVEEESMLDSFGIVTKMYPQEIYYGKEEERYGVNWVMQTQTREDARHFFEEIGFPQERKQAALVSMPRHER